MLRCLWCGAPAVWQSQAQRPLRRLVTLMRRDGGRWVNLDACADHKAALANQTEAYALRWVGPTGWEATSR